MSVQAGTCNWNGEPVRPEFLAGISASVAEYGPDGETTYEHGSIRMLYRPFHTTVESRAERQPYLSARGNVITWDGRLDNRDELIAQLRGDLTVDRTDVAIVAAAFDRWRMDCFAKLIGDWALAVWNPQEKEVIFARDYIGIRHLFYYPTATRVTWCTHLAPLAQCGNQFTLCDEYIAGYLAFHPDAHLTPFREIHAVPPGKVVHIRGTETIIRTYWAFNTRLRTKYKSDGEYEEQYRHLFHQAVRRRLRTTSPVLADLSGGFDSSSMVCMADDILSKEGAEAPRLDTFSYYDSSEPHEDDFLYLVKVAEKRSTSGFRVDLRGTGDSLSFENLTFSATPGFGVRTEVKAAISDILQRHPYRVMLSGLGGDEVNGQSLNPTIQMADLLMQLRFTELARQLVAWTLLIRKRPLIELLFQSVLQLFPGAVRAQFSAQGKPEFWINHEFARRQKLSAIQIQNMNGLFFLRPSVRDAVQTINSLAQQIGYARPSVLEKRYPYLDQTLVEFLTTIPLDQLLRPGQRRCLMRRALAGLIPPEVLQRKTKASAARCYCVTLVKHWEMIESMFLSSISSRRGYVNDTRICETLLGMKNGHVPPNYLRLLRALCLEVWLRDAEARGIISSPSSARSARYPESGVIKDLGDP
jgi:asparagine synthase (glutamine-hydrolysing)